MPLVQCTGCRAVFNVALEVVNTEQRCPKCRTVFVATVRRSGPRRKQTPQVVYWIAGIGVFAVVLFLVATALRKEEPDSGSPSGSAQAADREQAGAAGPPGTDAAAAESPDVLRATTESFLAAVEEKDVQALASLILFPGFQDRLAREDPDLEPWQELDEVGKTLARQAITERVLASSEDEDEFLAQARLEACRVVEETDQEARVQLLLRHLFRTELQQEQFLDLARIGPRWLVVGVERGPVVNPREVREKEQKEIQDLRRRQVEGVIEQVEFLADTPLDVRARIEGLVATLEDLSAGREASAARRELVALGKPAIPALLNVIVGREAMETPEQAQLLNLADQSLQDITLLNMGFAPGSHETLGGESVAANQRALRRWFKWWQDHKDTWTGPEPPDPAEDEDF